MTTRRRSGGCGCVGSLALLVVALPVIAALLYGLDALVLAPWAYSLTGRPTLVGAWAGDFTTPSGAHLVLFLDLRHPFLTNGEREAQGDTLALMSGHGSWCAADGRHGDDIPLDGYVPLLAGAGGAADGVLIDLQSAQYAQPGLQPAYLSGGWRADTLTLTALLIFWDADAQALVSSTSDPDFNTPTTIVLHKADAAAFHAACAALPPPAP